MTLRNCIVLLAVLSASLATRAEAQCPASCSTGGTAASYTNTGNSSPAILGTNSYAAQWWEPLTIGVRGSANIGVHGSGYSIGVQADGIDGVVANTTAAGGIGVRANSSAGDGMSSTSSGGSSNAAVRGVGSNGSIGVWGQSSTYNGVYGKTSSTSASAIYAENLSGGGYGVAGRVSSSGSGIAVLGDSGNSGTSYAGYFTGRVYVQGYLNKSGGGFLIDHPVDPEHFMLNHSFVESPEMKNVYDGMAVADSQGEVWIELPRYFGKLNRDFRYQLTCVGGFAQVYVAEEIRENKFKIAGARPNMKISWQVTGVRKDPWAVANDPGVEIPKVGSNKGKYLNPESYGLKEQLRIQPLDLAKR